MWIYNNNFSDSNIKKKIAILIIPIILVGCSNVQLNRHYDNIISIKNTESYSEYKQELNNLKKISVEEFQQKTERNDNFYVLWGRETCPYCVDFLPKLVKEKKK